MALPFRLIHSPPAPGAVQMALDEALLAACADDPAGFVPVLRLYRFEPPCLSLGRFQPFADVDVGACAAGGVEIVRRPTGGQAVLHERDLTYALIAPADASPFAGGVRASARRIGGALAAAARLLGAAATVAGPDPPPGRRPADCFAVTGAFEPVVEGRKLAGSAQLRRGPAALQHGTLRLHADAGRAARYLAPVPGAADRGPAPATGRPVSLAEAAGRPVSFDEAAAAIVAAFRVTLGLTFADGALTPAEQARAAALEQTRYRTAAWTLRR
jgi:lipoate-protein ligase A